MRHNVVGRLFGRTANQRKALLRGLVSSLIEHQRIETTLAKAKETRKVAERLVTLGKRGDLHAKRLVLAKVPNRSLVVKLFDEIAPRFADRNGGYLRIIATRRRVNDRSQMAVLEFVDYEELRGNEPAGKKKDKKAPKTVAPKEKEKKEKKEKKEAAPEEKGKKAEASVKKKEKKAEATPEEKKEKKAKAAPKKKGKKAKAAPKKKGKKAKAAPKKKGKK